MIDVVIVTLRRNTLDMVCERIKEVIPDPRIILVLDKGVIGDLRNKGLDDVTSDFVCFIDDDILVNKKWFTKGINYLKEHKNTVCVNARTREIFTAGSLICKTKQLKEANGFPKLDSHLGYKVKVVVLENVFVEHLVSELDMFRHLFHWFTHGFYTETKFGFNMGIKGSLFLIVRYLKEKKPSYAVSYFFWLVKAIFIKIYNFIF